MYEKAEAVIIVLPTFADLHSRIKGGDAEPGGRARRQIEIQQRISLQNIQKEVYYG